MHWLSAQKCFLTSRDNSWHISRTRFSWPVGEYGPQLYPVDLNQRREIQSKPQSTVGYGTSVADPTAFYLQVGKLSYLSNLTPASLSRNCRPHTTQNGWCTRKLNCRSNLGITFLLLLHHSTHIIVQWSTSQVIGMDNLEIHTEPLASTVPVASWGWALKEKRWMSDPSQLTYHVERCQGSSLITSSDPFGPIAYAFFTEFCGHNISRHDGIEVMQSPTKSKLHKLDRRRCQVVPRTRSLAHSLHWTIIE
jgi:hypothetical protein